MYLTSILYSSIFSFFYIAVLTWLIGCTYEISIHLKEKKPLKFILPTTSFSLKKMSFSTLNILENWASQEQKWYFFDVTILTSLKFIKYYNNKELKL